MEACIMCHEFKSGEPVEDTTVLRTLRKLKADFPPVTLIWGKPSGNTLVVCSTCTEKHAKKRKAYEGKVLMHAIIAAALLLFIVLLPFLAMTFQWTSLLVGLLLAGLLMALPLLDYVPPLAPKAAGLTMTGAGAGGRAVEMPAAPSSPSGSAPVQTPVPSVAIMPGSPSQNLDNSAAQTELPAKTNRSPAGSSPSHARHARRTPHLTRASSSARKSSSAKNKSARKAGRR